MEDEPSNMDMYHLRNLHEQTMKVTKLWSNYSKQWEITSLESLFERTGAMLGGTYKTLLPSETIQNVIYSISIYLSREALSLEKCLDSALMKTMSTYSIVVPSLPTSASVVGGKRTRSPVAHSSQATDSSQDSENGDEEIFSQLSYISFTKKGHTEKRGLQEDVSELKVHVSTSVLYRPR